MSIDSIFHRLPESVKRDVIDFTDCHLKDGRDALRITLDRILTEAEKARMKSKHIVGVDCLCQYRYAPEIRHSYFYLV